MVSLMSDAPRIVRCEHEGMNDYSDEIIDDSVG